MRLSTPFGRAALVLACVSAPAKYAGAATIAVPAGGDFQAALNAAAPGDVITLAPGATYVGNFTLPVKGSSQSFITVRSAAPDSALPPDGVRITPTYATVLPKIKSPTSEPALRTAAGAHHWKLMFLEFLPNMSGYYDIITLGSGDVDQYQLSQVPYALVLDRLYIHGDRTLGQKRGISLNSRDTTISNSYIAEMKAVGQDSQAIAGTNGPGNFLIENNYLEGAAENFIIGGGDPVIPNLVTTNVTFRGNYLSKPLGWRDPIVAAPTGVSANAASGSGSLGAGTYYYRVVARAPAGQTNIARSDQSSQVSATIPSGATGRVTISWTPVANATEYQVYGRTSGSQNVYWTTTATAFTDSGASGASGSPSGVATKWSVKNIFELKNAQDVIVEGNVFENCWIADQNGYAIVLTPRNQDGTAPWSVVQRVTFRNNLVRHAAGGVNILGTDNEQPSQLTNHLTIRNNIFDDIGGTWGTESRTFQIGDGGDAIAIDHNTIDSSAPILMSIYGGTTTNPTRVTGFSYTNNMSEHSTYGFFGDAMVPGISSISAYFPGYVMTRNVLAGGTASDYPAGNYFPSVSSWRAGFVDFNGADYRLVASSPYKNGGTDGLDLGADVVAVTALAATALSGDNRNGVVTRGPAAPTNVRVVAVR